MNSRIPVIIDTDPGVDDVVALLYALASPEFEILAFIVSYGNTDVESSILNILKMYQALSRHFERFPQDKVRFPNFEQSSKPLLVRGAERPLEGDIHSASYFHGRDGLSNIAERHPDLNLAVEESAAATGSQPHPQLQITNESLLTVVANLLKSRPPRSITYVTLGPLTSLAQIMRAEGNLVRERIGRVVSMGGALDVPGNTSPVAEFNFFADPYAVKQLLSPSLREPSLSLPLERFDLLPLDVTTRHQLPFVSYKAHVDPKLDSPAWPSRSEGKSPLVHFTSAFLEKTREVMLGFGSDAMELHDIIAVWFATQNAPISAGRVLSTGWEAETRKFEIERIGELTRGMLVVDRRDDEGAYAPGANRAEVQAELDRLGGSHKGHWESTAVPALVEVEQAPAAPRSEGVWCVRGTPGPDVVLKELLSRVWGVLIADD